jgi:hypothetical protein
MIEHDSHSIRDKVIHLIHGESADRSTEGLENLFLHLAYKAYPGETPPEYVLHSAQVATVTGAELSKMDDIEKEWGMRYAWGHDMGRAVDLGSAHTMAGARILREFGYRPSLITFTLAHHRWGLGVPILSQDNFPEAVDKALSNGTIDSVMDEIVAKRGIAALAVLLADNSKMPVAPGSFETKIVPFNLTNAESLIETQIKRGRYTEGSREHVMDQLGARFLHAMIPHLEKRLGMSYAPDGTGTDSISRAQARWPIDQEQLLAKWEKIHYDVSHEPKIL